MPRLISTPASIPVPGGKIIREHVGLISTGTLAVSVAHMIAPADWGEPFQTPEFDEVTLVLKGEWLVYDGVAASTARAGRCSPALVEPPDAATTAAAFSSALRVTMARGRMLEAISSITFSPAAMQKESRIS